MLQKIVILSPWIARLGLLVLCCILIYVSADTFVSANEELEALIEAGEVPRCIKNMIIGVAGMGAGVGIILLKRKR